MPAKKKNPARRSADGKGRALMEQSGKVNLSDLDKMVAESMKDIPSDAELSDEDDDLMNELLELAGEESSPPAISSPVAPVTSVGTGSHLQKQIAFLKERLEMYAQAESNAKSKGESTKARRMNRGVKTLQDLLKKTESGQNINDDDIPPPVAPGSSNPTSQETTPESERAPAVGQQAVMHEPKPVLWTPSEQSHPVPAPRPVAPSIQQAAQSTGGQAIPQQPVSGGFILGESTLITADIPVYDPFGVYNTYQPTLGQQIKDIPDNRQSSSPASLPSNTSSASRPSPLSVTPGHTDTMITKTESETQNMMIARRDQYKAAALQAKRSGDNGKAVRYMKIAKQFDQVIAALERGDPIDLSGMPPPPPNVTVDSSSKFPVQPTERSAMQASASTMAAAAAAEEIDIPELDTQGIIDL
ncbi:hypothetical protein LSH36_316g09000 [Paralvinella palmiformis]|uniref:DM14 domain-containing protein n=1 Tax=Paralvinella palmiformis TaxID=53620 RepID=A0AAD9JGT2_9ANNE|nr:hypothetical protein LSH36_316g09000 [Paralvinella palmiformis]